MHRSRRFFNDVLAQCSAAAIAAGCLVVFAALAIAGASMTSRLGGAGWLIYVIVMTTFALLFGPLVASAFNIHQRGSARWRAARDERIAADRRKYGLGVRGDD